MEARRFPEPEVVGSIPTAGDFVQAFGLRRALFVSVGDPWIAMLWRTGRSVRCGWRHASRGLVTNDSKATVSVLYWYGNYPTQTGPPGPDFLEPGLALALDQL